MVSNQTKKYASLYLSDKFINIKAYSGYRSMMRDPKATDFLLDIDVPLKDLGNAILRSVRESRHIPLEDLDRFIKEFEQGREAWIQNICLRYKIRNQSELFKKIACCSIEAYNNLLIFMPNHHERGDAWSSTLGGESDYITIPADSALEQIGEAMWQALRRCTGRRPDMLGQ